MGVCCGRAKCAEYCVFYLDNFGFIVGSFFARRGAGKIDIFFFSVRQSLSFNLGGIGAHSRPRFVWC